jgi:hypothetical protein
VAWEKSNKARDTRLERTVAIKILPTPLAGDVLITTPAEHAVTSTSITVVLNRAEEIARKQAAFPGLRRPGPCVRL